MPARAAARHDDEPDGGDAAGRARPIRRLAALDVEDRFRAQPTSSDDLPNPRPLILNLTRCVMEILAGARDLEQIARWLDADVYTSLAWRTAIRTRSRQARGAAPARPRFVLGSTRIQSPADGVVETVTVVHEPARAKAVAMRLEGIDRRWRVTALKVL